MVYPERPASARQVRFLRKLCRERGVAFQRPRTRGEAQSMIDRLLAAARSERAQRPPRPQQQAPQRARRAHPERWRFGRGQTLAQERTEIKQAHLAGRAEQYVAGQRWARMIDAETQRRQARKRERRAHSRAGR